MERIPFAEGCWGMLIPVVLPFHLGINCTLPPNCSKSRSLPQTRLSKASRRTLLLAAGPACAVLAGI